MAKNTLLWLLGFNVLFTFVLIRDIEISSTPIIPTVVLGLNMLLGVIEVCCLFFDMNVNKSDTLTP